MAKIYPTIQMKLNHLSFKNVTDFPTKRIFMRYHSDKHFSEFLGLPTRWRQNQLV